MMWILCMMVGYFTCGCGIGTSLLRKAAVEEFGSLKEWVDAARTKDPKYEIWKQVLTRDTGVSTDAASVANRFIHNMLIWPAWATNPSFGMVIGSSMREYKHRLDQLM